MTDVLKQIMIDYDKASDDASFKKDHPVFKMAAHIDELRKDLGNAVASNKRFFSAGFSQGYSANVRDIDRIDELFIKTKELIDAQ